MTAAAQSLFYNKRQPQYRLKLLLEFLVTERLRRAIRTRHRPVVGSLGTQEADRADATALPKLKSQIQSGFLILAN